MGSSTASTCSNARFSHGFQATTSDQVQLDGMLSSIVIWTDTLLCWKTKLVTYDFAREQAFVPSMKTHYKVFALVLSVRTR